MKAAGVAAGVIVLLGAGGRRYADSHVRDTTQAINAMRLDAGDLIYLSELVAGDETPYAQAARQADSPPLSSAERIAQGDAITAGLRFTHEQGAPHISRYDIREFVY
jgi:hypothetical protein